MHDDMHMLINQACRQLFLPTASKQWTSWRMTCNTGGIPRQGSRVLPAADREEPSHETSVHVQLS